MNISGKLMNWHMWAVKGYKLREKIATGGMSIIYKASSRKTNETIAIKILFPQYSKHKTKLQNLLAEKQVEGEMASHLSHPNVIQTHEFNKLYGHYYFVMEYVNGDNLKYIVYHNPEMINGGKLDIIRQTARGLHYIHSKGIIHRDICPKNILVSKNGQVKIIDFGLSVSKRSRFRGFGERAGTPSYMAPEQIKAMEADERTDIYSLGVTVYELLAERPPFAGEDTYAKMQHHLTSDPVPLKKRAPDVPEELEKIISKAMQKNPKNRYQSMAALLNDIEKIDLRGNKL